MSARNIILAGTAAFGLAVYGCGQLIGEPEFAPGRRPVTPASATAQAEGLDWKTWDMAGGADLNFADAEGAVEAEQAPSPVNPWSIEAEWAPPD